MTPRGKSVLAKVAELEEKTSGGILLPNQSQKRPTSGDVISLGDGDHDFTLKVGDTIIYSKFGLGATDIVLQGEEHILISEDDVIGIMPQSGATADDIPHLKPIGDRVLLKITEQSDVTMGGVILPDTAKEKPLSGTVVRCGPGKLNDDGTRKVVKVSEGDQVVYFKYAGDAMETSSGEKYIVLHESDILCKC